MKLIHYVESNANCTGCYAGFAVHQVTETRYNLRTWGNDNKDDKNTTHATLFEAQTLGMQWLLFCMTKGT